MDKTDILKLLEEVSSGTTEVDVAFNILKDIGYEDLDHTKVDHHRAMRTGYPEVIFAQGKTPAQVRDISRALYEKNSFVIATRATIDHYNKVKDEFDIIEYDEQSKIIIVGHLPEPKTDKTILIITGGTSDIPVAEEARITAQSMGSRVETLYDAGVAGVHRLFSNIDKVTSANVIVAVAGMEGALPTIVSGLVKRPVISVPTSVGYGASFNGLSALLTMLNSCSPGTAVVNIDNGFGAGYMAAIINSGDEK